jgi:hypothetical protein
MFMPILSAVVGLLNGSLLNAAMSQGGLMTQSML